MNNRDDNEGAGSGAITGLVLAAAASWSRQDDDTQNRIRGLRHDTRDALAQIRELNSRGEVIRGRLPTVSDWTRGVPLLHKVVRNSAERDKQERRSTGLETAYCAETVAITYEEMGLLVTEKRENFFDPGSFWSGDDLPLTAGYELGQEISIVV